MPKRSVFALVDDAGIPMGVVGADVARDLVGSGRAKGVWCISAEVIEHAMRHVGNPRPHTSRLIAAGPLPKARLRRFEPDLDYEARSA